MPVLQPFSGVRGQQLYSIARSAWKLDFSIRLYKIVDVLEEFGRAPRLGRRFRVPLLRKLQKRVHQIHRLQIEMPDYKFRRIARANSVLLYFAVGGLHTLQHRGTARKSSQHRAEIEFL